MKLNGNKLKYRYALSLLAWIVLGFIPGGATAELLVRSDGTVLDSNTGLLWQQSASEPLQWLEAVRYCNALDLAGTGGWRMPFHSELTSLLEATDAGDALESSSFSDLSAQVYWSLNRDEQHPDQVWGVSFADGQPYLFNREGYNFPVRCLIETAEAVYLPLINKWQSAWTAQDVDAYLACYGTQFVPGGGRTRQDWESQRRVRLQRPKSIEVKISNVKVIAENGTQAEIMFQQNYRSESYQDQVMKVLTLGLERGELVIVGERSI